MGDVTSVGDVAPEEASSPEDGAKQVADVTASELGEAGGSGLRGSGVSSPLTSLDSSMMTSAGASLLLRRRSVRREGQVRARRWFTQVYAGERWCRHVRVLQRK